MEKMEMKLCSADEIEGIVIRAVESVLSKTGLTATGRTSVEPLFSEATAAKLFDVNPNVMRDARERGEIDFVRVGRFIRYEGKHLEAFKKRQLNRKIGA